MMPNIPSGSEINYFSPKIESDKTRESSKDAKEQMEAFEEFSSFLTADPQFECNFTNGSHEHTKDALAFFIEATKQLYKEEWKGQLKDIKNKIKQIRHDAKNSEDAHAKTTWLMYHLISNLYQKVLVGKSISASKKKEKTDEDFYNSAFENMQNLESINKIIENAKGSIEIGGIHRTLLPHWYLDHYIHEKEEPEPSRSPRSPSL